MATHSDGWDRLSQDGWYETTDPGPYSKPPRRVRIARAFGVVGVLATLGFAVVALAPRMPEVARRANALADRVVLPGDPVLNAGPEPLPLERTALHGALAVSTPALGFETLPLTAEDSSADSAAEVSPPSPSPAVADAPTPARPVAEPNSAPEPNVSVQPSTGPAAPSAEPNASEASNASVQETPAATTRPEPTAHTESTPPEPSLSPEEIQEREERYEQWLKDEGLERIR